MRFWRVAAAAGLVLFGTACSSSSSSHSGRSGAVIAVPRDASTITKAVAKAKPGDLILVSPGTYAETVKINVPRVTLRGTDRAKVIIDGQVLRPDGIVVTAPDVTVANLTVRNATLNGVLFTGESDKSGGIAKGSAGYTRLDPSKFPPLAGFHVDHVTSYNNGLYGIYAFDTQYGVIENSYTSGMADSGIYVGQCKPCHILVRGNVMERNAVGYEGTNAGGDLLVTGNRIVGNRVGATTDSDYQEAFIPQSGATVAGNLVADNAEHATPEQADGGFGIGLGIAGGTHDLLTRNLVTANPVAGLLITSADGLAPIGNTVTSNVFLSNGLDVSFAPTASAPGSGNCFSGNVVATTVPAGATTTLRCPVAAGAQTGASSTPATNAPPGIAFTEVQAPPVLPSLPAPASALAPWTTASVPVVAVAAIGVPAASLLARQSDITW